MEKEVSLPSFNGQNAAFSSWEASNVMKSRNEGNKIQERFEIFNDDERRIG